MNSIRKNSADVEQEQHEKANNSDVLTSGLHGETVSDIGGVQNKIHGFSKTVAEFEVSKTQKIGWAGASVLRFLSHLQTRHGLLIDGKKWIRINLDNIAAQYPYFDRSSVDKAISRLIKARACEAKNLNKELKRPKYDRTRCYHIPTKWMNAAESELRYFHIALAVQVGVPAAVLHYNFTYWMGEFRREKKEPVFELAPATLVTLQPFSRETIKRAIKKLVEQMMIFSVPGSRCHYTDVPSFSSGSKVDETSSKVDKGGSKVDKGGSKVDNDSIESIIVVSLEENSKSQPAVAFEHSSSFAEKNNSSSVDSQVVDTDNDAHAPSKLPVVLSPFVASSFPVISSFDELHFINTQLAPRLSRCSYQSQEHTLNVCSNIADRFLLTLDQQWVEELYDEANDETTFESLFTKFQAWFHNAGISQDLALFPIVYFGVCEVIVGAFIRQRHNDDLLHPFRLLRPLAYDIHIVRLRRAEDRRNQAVAEEFAERRLTFKSLDQHLEEEPELPPAQKARIFKQGLNAMNRVGWICLGGELRTDGIVFTRASIKRVEALFERSPLMTPGDLLRVMKASVALHEHWPEPPPHFRKGCKWHARMAHHLPTFVRYLGAILRQLNMDLPAIEYLEDEDAYDLEVAA